MLSLLAIVIVSSLALSLFYLTTHWAEITRTKDTDGDGLTDYDEVNKYNTIERTNDTDWDGLNDYDEVIVYHTDAHNRDTDGDYVTDGIEANLYNTDPLKIDTSGLGLDDFNAIYTYELDPRNQTAVKEFLQKIPNVEARHWDYHNDGELYYGIEIIAQISMRDPLIKWYAERAEIRWVPEEISTIGEKAGLLFINGEPPFLGTYDLGEASATADQPSFFFTHGRKGCCVDSSTANLPILRLMDGGKYKAVQVGGDVPDMNERIGHAWCEAFIDGKVYAVDFEIVSPRDWYYREYDYNVTELWRESRDYLYDPNWFLK